MAENRRESRRQSGEPAQREALIAAGGQIDLARFREEADRIRRAGGLLVAADRGLEAFWALREAPDIAVGDFDSVSSEALAWYTGCEGFRLERHRPEKDQSDTELAFETAREAGVKSLTLMGATGTRLDHTLSNIHLLKTAEDLGLHCILLDGNNRIRLVSGRTVFYRERDRYPYISFLPLSEEVFPITLTGFRYPLKEYHMVLGAESTRCVSNEIEQEEAVLDFSSGLLLAVEAND